MPLLIVLFSLLAVLSTSSTKTLNANSTEMPKKLVIAHGGFNSCKNSKNKEGVLDANIFRTLHFSLVAGDCKKLNAEGKPCHPKADWLTESLREHFSERFQLEWFVSCQALDVKVLHWVKSDQPEVKISGSREDMWAELKEFAENRSPANVIGHSYGAWISMHSVLKINEPVHSLTTIDPISPVKCTPVSARTGSKECKKFPSDVDTGMLESIFKKAPLWTHYWQKVSDGAGLVDLGLHSGPTYLAGVDEHEQFVDHLQIDADQIIWERFKRTVAKQ